MATLLKTIDINILRMIHEYSQNSIFDQVMPMITFLGNKGIIWILLCIVLFTQKKYRRIAAFALFALILSTVMGEGILKYLFHRTRPFLEVEDIKILVEKPLSYSFPSGHTASSFAVAGVIARTIERYKISVMVLAGLMAFSRLYLFVHYPSDVLGGMILGLSCAKIALMFYKKDAF